jgi:kynureninase
MTTATELGHLEDDALRRDEDDRVGSARERFLIPPDDSTSGHGQLAYMAGNSLGLQPAGVAADVAAELANWATLAVEGHARAQRPWGEYHALLRGPMARIVGAREDETVVMNSLTVNLHLLLASFYRPAPGRYQIVMEDSAFPSDSYAFRSHATFRGYESHDAIVRLRPRDGERLLRTQDVIDYLRLEADSTALLLLGGVNYLTGQLMDIEAITAAAREAGITVGWDLAHAVGNVPLELHDWGVDFAAWCTYKYLNAGPGSIAGAFVHERHLADATLHRLHGWFSNDPANRFEMLPDLTPVMTADSWMISNSSVLSMTPLFSSLALFDELGMDTLRARSHRLTGYLAELLDQVAPSTGISIVTPQDPSQRGCQLSVAVPGDPSEVHARIRSASGVLGDVRMPDIIRLAPIPLYTTYHDCWRAADAITGALA